MVASTVFSKVTLLVAVLGGRACLMTRLLEKVRKFCASCCVTMHEYQIDLAKGDTGRMAKPSTAQICFELGGVVCYFVHRRCRS